jgi:hypothetical protein
MSDNKIESTNVALHQRGASQEPQQISSDATELPESELNKVVGGFRDLQFVKTAEKTSQINSLDQPSKPWPL